MQMPPNNQSLSIAARLLVGEVAVAIALSFALGRLALAADWVILAVWVVNFIPAWFFSRAAKQLGRSQVAYGLLAALGPPGGIAAYVWLHSIDLAMRLDRSRS